MVKSRFADELRGHLDINSAAYGACTCGHAWITWDKDVVANFCTRANSIAEGYEPKSPVENAMYKSQKAIFGEFSRQDAYRACWEFLHELSIEDALNDEDPLIQFLAVADKRVGKRRLAKLEIDDLHPLSKFIVEKRTRREEMPEMA